MNILGSHNTMSYLKPAKWYMKLFSFVAKCQNKTIVEQVALGIRVFDIRIRFDSKTHNPYFAHGLIRYTGENVEDVFNYLNKYNVKVRLILETTRFTKDVNYQENMFRWGLDNYKRKYKNIAFFEGTNKHTWKYLDNELKKNIIKYVQYVGSMDGFWLYKIWPRLYAIKHNCEITKLESDAVKFIDFVGNYY